MMKKSDTPVGPEQNKHKESETAYPDVIVPEGEEPEEENPTAYALLSKIEDPYYRKQSAEMNGSRESFHEENKSNLPIYKSFYSVTPTKSASSSIFQQK